MKVKKTEKAQIFKNTDLVLKTDPDVDIFQH